MFIHTKEEGVEIMEPVSLNKIKKHETEAYKASVEIDHILHHEIEGNFRPWQFENHSVHITPLKTTYDELFILWKEELRFRPGFKVEDHTVTISNIFAKINGTHKNLEQYWKELDELKQNKDRTIFIDTVPFISNNKKLILDPSILNHQGFFDVEKIKSHSGYPLSYLRTSSQNLILSKINDMICFNELFNFEITTEFKFKVLNIILNLGEKYLNLIQNFDYPFNNPKLVLFHSNKNSFSQEDAIAVAFLYMVGFDIVIFTPTGYNNIEKYVNESFFQSYRLDHVAYDLQLPRKVIPTIARVQRKRVTAGLLGIFLGGLGLHKFYLGRPIQGALMLLFSWTFIPTIIGIVQGIGYLNSNDKTFYKEIKESKRVTAGLLALIFGGFGVHKFYLGKTFQGLLHLIFAVTIIPFIVGIMEGLRYLKATDEEFIMKYC